MEIFRLLFETILIAHSIHLVNPTFPKDKKIRVFNSFVISTAILGLIYFVTYYIL